MERETKTRLRELWWLAHYIKSGHEYRYRNLIGGDVRDLEHGRLRVTYEVNAAEFYRLATELRKRGPR